MSAAHKRTARGILPLRQFFLTFCCFFLAMMLLIAVVLGVTIHRERLLYEAESLRNADALRDAVDQQLDSYYKVGYSIFKSRWYSHYRMPVLFAEEFTFSRRQEICAELRARLLSMEFASDLVLVTPGNGYDSVVCSNSWLSVRDYTRGYRILDISQQDNIPHVSIHAQYRDQYYLLPVADPTARAIPSQVGVIIDRKAFGQWLGTQIPDQANYVDVRSGTQELYSSGDPDQALIYSGTTSSTSGLQITIGFPSFQEIYGAQQLYNLVLWSIIIFLVSVILSFALVLRRMKALDSLVNRFSGVQFRSEKDVYSYVDEYITTVSETNDRLHRQMDHYLRTTRNELLLSMVTDPDFDFSSERVRISFPWISSGLPYVVVYIHAKDARRVRIPAEGCAQVQRFSVLGSELGIIIWFQSAGQAQQQLESLRELLTDHVQNNGFFDISPVCTQPEAMREAFSDLRRNEQIWKSRISDIPVEAQLRFIGAVQNGNFSDCKRVIDELRGSYTPDTLFTALNRLSAEYSITPVEGLLRHWHSDDAAAAWSAVLELTETLCGTVQNFHNQEIAHSADHLRTYVERHFRDHDMSLKKLESHFGLSSTLISRTFKEELGVNFSVYLLSLRITAAMHLLDTTDLSISEVSDAVGYDNYLTFKRSFVRFCNMLPMEYRARPDREAPVFPQQ